MAPIHTDSWRHGCDEDAAGDFFLFEPCGAAAVVDGYHRSKNCELHQGTFLCLSILYRDENNAVSVKSSENAFDVLRILTKSAVPVGAPEVALMLNIPLTSTIRALSTLEAGGYARRSSGTARFELGSAGQTLAYAFIAQFPMRNVALPYLQHLTSTSRCSCSLFQRHGHYVIRIAFIAGTAAIINIGRLGEWHGLSDGAAGLVVLAGQASSEMIAEDEPRPNSAVSSAKLQEIRSRGYAVEPSRLEQGGFDLAFALPRDAAGPAGSVVVEGVASSVLETNEPDGWKNIVDHLREVLRTDASVLLSPYAQLHPDEIEFDNAVTQSLVG